jgi:capsular exopolysaccharide synthesis family protein
MSRIDEALRKAQQSVSASTEPPGVEFSGETAPTRSAMGGSGSRDHAGVDIVVESGADAAAREAVDLSSESWDCVVRVGTAVNEKLVVSKDAEPAAVEQYRKLAAALHQVPVERGTRVVMVASALAGEGKTLTAANLALTLAESFGREVLLIDADLRRPTIHQVFDLQGAGATMPGLNDRLNADHDTKLPLARVSPRLTVLPAGQPNPDPMRALTSERMRRIINEAAARFDWVILDTPPVALLPDAKLLVEMADMVVFVISAGSTPYTVVQRVVQAIGPERIVGVVLNRVTIKDAPYHYYNTDYYQPRTGT